MAGKPRYSAVVLRNKGVQVDVCALTTNDDGTRMRAIADEHGAPVIEKRWVRFDANAMADIEDHFGTLPAFETASSETPNTVIRRGLAICWGIDDVREVGLMMVEGQLNTYSTAIGVALAIANGVDPTQAAEMLEVGIKAVAEAEAELKSEMANMLAKAREDQAKETVASPGATGPEPGVEPDENSTPFGDTLPLKSVS